jgi:hypothetical protein
MEEASLHYPVPRYQSNPSSQNADFGYGSNVPAASQVGNAILANFSASFTQPQSFPRPVQNIQGIDGASVAGIEHVIRRLASLNAPEQFCNEWLKSYQLYSKNRLFHKLKECLIDFYTKKFEELDSRLSIEFSSIEIEQELMKLTSAQACQLEECRTDILGIPLKPSLKAAWFSMNGSTANSLEICKSAYEQGNCDVYVGRMIIQTCLNQKNPAKALEVVSKLKDKLCQTYQNILLKIESKRATEADINQGDRIIASRSSLILMEVEIHLNQGDRDAARRALGLIFATTSVDTIKSGFDQLKFNNLLIEAGLFTDGEILAEKSESLYQIAYPLIAQCWSELCSFLSNPFEEKGNKFLSTFNVNQELQKESSEDTLDLTMKERIFLIKFIANCLNQYIFAIQTKNSIENNSSTVRLKAFFDALIRHFNDHKIYLL